MAQARSWGRGEEVEASTHMSSEDHSEADGDPPLNGSGSLLLLTHFVFWIEQTLNDK